MMIGDNRTKINSMSRNGTTKVLFKTLRNSKTIFMFYSDNSIATSSLNSIFN
jgi:hypothetical protein